MAADDRIPTQMLSKTDAHCKMSSSLNRLRLAFVAISVHFMFQALKFARYCVYELAQSEVGDIGERVALSKTPIGLTDKIALNVPRHIPAILLVTGRRFVTAHLGLVRQKSLDQCSWLYGA